MATQTAVIFDIDGTLANITPVLKRTGYIPDPDDAHKTKVINATLHAPVNGWVADLASRTFMSGRGVLVITAREERHRPVTEAWLAANGIHHHELHMRGDDDARPDADVKRDIYESIADRWDVEHAVDDNPEVLDMWKSLDIETTVVPGYPFNMG